MNIPQYVRNVIRDESGFRKNNFHAQSCRCLGAIEAVLVIEGVLMAGVPCGLKDIEEEIWWWAWKLWTRKRKETYREYILRKANEYLKGQDEKQ